MIPATSPLLYLTIPIFFGLFFGGGFLGSQVSHALAPGSGLAEFISFLTLPAAFIIGIVFWAGSAIPAALITTLISGFIVAIISTNSGFSWVLIVYTAMGLFYDVIRWRFARAGYLRFPTE